jgi:predicted dehydrogenase
MRLGLIGRGRRGRNIERTLLSFGDVAVVPIGRNEPLQREFDGVIIASPSASHAELALPHIQAGIPTFIEKPMATSVADAERIREAAQHAQTAVFVGHLQLYNPAFQAVLDLLPTLGPIQYVHCDSANDNPRADSSVLWDWLPHDLSMARAIFAAEPTCVQAWSLTGTENIQAAVSRYHYGAASLVSVTSWLSLVRRTQVTICAEQGVLIFDDRAQRKLTLHQRDGKVSYPGYETELPLTRELRAFLDLIRSRSTDSSHAALGVAIVRAIEAAEESIRNGGSVTKIGM